MKIQITLDTLTCNKQQEISDDEIYLLYSFREVGQQPSPTRLPSSGGHWGFTSGRVENLARLVIDETVDPTKQYVLRLWLWEEDAGSPDVNFAQRFADAPGKLLEKYPWLGGFGAAVVGFFAALFDKDDLLGFDEVTIRIVNAAPPPQVDPTGAQTFRATGDGATYTLAYTIGAA